MNRKKFLALVITVVMLVTMLVFPAQADSTILFEDDFSSDNLAAKWQNPVLDNDPGTGDTECENVATVENGVLELNNEDQFGSFFYLGMGEQKLLNFTLTMRIQAHQFNGSWVGISFRKDFNDRFNGCNNNMATISFRTDASGNTVVTAEAYRGYTGSAPVLLSNNAESSLAVAVDEWIEWRLEVQDTVFKTYVNGKLMGQWEYKKNQNEGMISLNCCIFDGAVDDIKLMEYEALSDGGNTDPDPTETNPVESTPSESNPVESTPSETNPEETTPSEPEVEPTSPSKQTLIDRKYKDVTIDNTFNVITLDRLLTVEEFLDSFYLADDVTIRLVDANGVEAADQDASVIDTMKLEVLQNGTVVKTYTLVIAVEEPTEPAETTPDNNDDESGVPTGVIIAIAAGIAAVAVVVVVLVVIKRKAGKKA